MNGKANRIQASSVWSCKVAISDRRTTGSTRGFLFLFENLVHCELKKHISWAQESTNLYFYRTHSGKEIDFLLERNQRKIAIEVKFSSTVTAHDFDNMKQLQKENPQLFDKGIVLYTGKTVIPFGTHFQAVPIANLL